ncbi:SGNH/GDSL hydrolase family protein [Arthrobacter sp. H14-L1]|uniref:SGNH/GDSL hydrolase family protein n=1 Tax=Arthrobacter sp. H14-L1 TaxID=2996697 RepID=UPI00227041F0|nr:SGNH/GDSL hydrolase family protein [Arthrobacter sp. H14-L1]MCY0905886.1 SGNH/GDSL hydrolase family protein [Arthrobacter sp. H14-L1]
MLIGKYDGGAQQLPLLTRQVSLLAMRLIRLSLGSVIAAAVISVVEAYWIGVHFRRAAAEDPPRAEGLYGSGYAGATIGLAVLGDSNALGVGASRSSQTIPALLARGLSAKAMRPVVLDNVAVSGAESRDLTAQIGLLKGIPDVTAILVGGNDVMQLRSIPASAALLAGAIRHLQSQGGQVVVGTCPDMGTIKALVPPLRFIAGWYSRVLAVAQTFVVLRTGGRAVAIGDMLGPQFLENPGQMFATDHFHSSPLGYARAARLLLPSVCAAAAPVTGVHLAVPHRIYAPTNRKWVAAMGTWMGRRALASARKVELGREPATGPVTGPAAPDRPMGIMSVLQRVWEGAAALAGAHGLRPWNWPA